MHLLVTAFRPFGGETVNPALQCLELLPPRIGAYEVRKVSLPVLFDGAWEQLRPLLDDGPSAVVLLGQAAGRSKLTFETAAINLRHARGTDESGRPARWEKILPQGPDGLFSTWPFEASVRALSADGAAAAAPSFSAGTFVCNELLYRSLHYLQGKNVPCCFVHVPLSPEQALLREGESPSMPPSCAARGVEALLSLYADSPFDATNGLGGEGR